MAESSTARNVVFVTAAKVLLLGVWLCATMLMARVLGTVLFGLYTLCTNAIRVVTNCFGDPLDMAVMREAPLHLKTDRPRALDLIRSAFWLRILVGTISIMIAAAVPWLVSRVVFDSPDYRKLALLTAVGILGDLFLRSVLGYFQANEQFGRFMWADAVWQIGRAATVLVLVGLHLLTATNAILLYITTPFVATVVGIFLMPRDVFTSMKPKRNQLSQIIHYSKWLVTATMMGAIYERLDLFMLGWFRGAAEVGVYGAAMTLAMIPDFLDNSIQTVLAPKIAPAFADGTFAQLQRRYLSISIPSGIVSAFAAWFLAGPVIQTFLTAKYSASVDVFKILVLGTVFNIVFTPLSSALLNFVAPRRVTVITSVGLLMVAIGGILAIPKFGVVGAAGVILGARVLVGTTVVIFASRLCRVTSPRQ